MLRPEISEFINKYQDLISSENLTELYKKAKEEEISFRHLTNCFLDASIDPLLFMSKVPEYYCFSNPKLKNIVIPSNITSIGQKSFAHCYNLTNVIIPNGVTTIDDDAFLGARITTIDIPESVTTIGEGVFAGTTLHKLILPSNCTVVSKELCNSCDLLTFVVLSDNTKEIEEGAFSDCSELKHLYLGKSIERIGMYAFKECYNLKKIELPRTLKYIDRDAFTHVSSEIMLFVYNNSYGHEYAIKRGMNYTLID